MIRIRGSRLRAVLLAPVLGICCVAAHAGTSYTIYFPVTGSSPASGATLLGNISTSEVLFSAEDTSSAQIAANDNNGPSSALTGVLLVTTDPTGADILLDFSTPVASVSVNFPGLLNNQNGGGLYIGSLTAFNSAAVGANPTQAQALPQGDQIYTSSNFEPNAVTVGGGVNNDIYAVQIESGQEGTPGQTYTEIDSVTYTIVGTPEPGAFILLGAGFLAIGLWRRKLASV